MRWILEVYGISVRRACELGGLSRASWYRKSVKSQQLPLRRRIREIAESRPRFGYQRIHVLLRREGWLVNHKRVHRLYRLEGLQLRMRLRRRKHMCLHRGVVPRAEHRGERLSMDFVHDQLFDGRPFRLLTVVDQWSREAVVVEPRLRFSGADVADVLEKRLMPSSMPTSITVDHGTEFTSKALEGWAWSRNVSLDFTHPGKPTENAYIESFNGRLRDECLNVNQFFSIEHARELITAWMNDYNHERPHGALNGLTPTEYAQGTPENQTSEADELQFRMVP